MEIILAIVGLVPQFAAAGMSIMDLWKLGSEVLSRETNPDGSPRVKDEDWDRLHAMEDALRARLQKPRT